MYDQKGYRNPQRRWRELSPGQQSATLLGAGVQLSLLTSALWDLSHRTDEQIRGRRSLWTAALFVNFVGPLAYFAWGRKRPGTGRPARRRPSGGK